MIKINANNFKEEAATFVRDWVKLLSDNEFEKAAFMLDTPESEEREKWDATKLKDIFLDYCWYERMPVINNPYQMDLSKEKIDYYTYDDGSGYAVEYDIPLDGEWGNLTAHFSFTRHDDQFIALLHNIHVL